ncbi:putative ras guanyl-nucleotide exchange factor protein [Cladophialophora carrionii]|uniref:Putative ras guanyl-nucleotide exchange factor protein n=1 Tax=Cladophialophora carrionii TaxID=86049 RepID=A0A1C1CXZ9_9EURO|nr:putative ras guanyl-nucleotide exchange factor protein [Cladophialophora carrionii]
MSTTKAPPTLRSLYRRLLRELPPTPQPRHTLPRTPIHASIRKHVVSSWGQQQQQQQQHSEAQAQARLQELEQFVTYLRAQRMYGTLLQRYNPGMGMDEEERVRLTARRVGMDLPVEYGDGGGDGFGGAGARGGGNKK